MLLPSTYAITLALLAVSVIFLGIWTTVLKKSGWRFELAYFDLCIGAVIGALILSFTVGSMGPDISVGDSFLLVGKRAIVFAVIAGCVFNLGNMLLVAAIEASTVGGSVPTSVAFGLLVTIIWSAIATPAGSMGLQFGGVAIAIVGGLLCAAAQYQVVAKRHKEAKAVLAEKAAAIAAAEGLSQQAAAQRRKKLEAESSEPGPLIGVALSIAAGLVMGTFFPVVGMSMEGELGFGNPFAVAALISLGMLVSSFVYNLYFLNLPVKGAPVSFFAYFTGSIGQHIQALLAGILLVGGLSAMLTAGVAPGDAKLHSPLVAYVVAQGAGVVGIICGAFVLKEFSDSTLSASKLVSVALLALLAGIALITYGIGA